MLRCRRRSTVRGSSSSGRSSSPPTPTRSCGVRRRRRAGRERDRRVARRDQGPGRVVRLVRRPDDPGRRQDQRQLRGVAPAASNTRWCAAPSRGCSSPTPSTRCSRRRTPRAGGAIARPRSTRSSTTSTRTSTAASSPGRAEDYGYENLKDRYKPKNNAIDSVAELKLVRGVDARFWALVRHRVPHAGRVRGQPARRRRSQDLAGGHPARGQGPRAGRPGQRVAAGAAVAAGQAARLVQPTNDEFRAFIADPKTALAPPTGEAGATPGAPARRPRRP
jgi:hypothetical protein